MIIIKPENKHTSNIVWTQEVIFRNIYVYTCAHMKEIAVSENGGHKVERELEESMGGFEGKKQKGEIS